MKLVRLFVIYLINIGFKVGVGVGVFKKIKKSNPVLISVVVYRKNVGKTLNH